MFQSSTYRLLGRSKSRQKRRISICVLVWICLSQFPLPVAHAHASDAHHDSELASHIQRKHSAGHDDSFCLHWHLIMPWEAGDAEDEDTPTHHPSPLGLWGAEGNVLPQSATIADFPPVTLEWIVCDSGDISRQSAASCWDTSALPASVNFTQTYLGVSLCALVCVSLR